MFIIFLVIYYDVIFDDDATLFPNMWQQLDFAYELTPYRKDMVKWDRTETYSQSSLREKCPYSELF